MNVPGWRHFDPPHQGLIGWLKAFIQTPRPLRPRGASVAQQAADSHAVRAADSPAPYTLAGERVGEGSEGLGSKALP